MAIEPNRVEEVFAAAVARTDPAERAALVDAACGADQALRSRVEALLASHDADDSFMAAPSAPELTVSAAAGHRAELEGAGTVIGRYKLLERIGEGGFGVVFMAEQQHPVRRKLALKLIKPGLDSRQVVARFEAERQALAMMDHPNIARVLDAGATEAGRPYFVMELVHGVPITEFCDKNQLPPSERLELFVQVCRAVQHAHTKGIIHRDIKPTNVLVTLHEGLPVPKVIDFGIAKATQSQLTEKTLFTHFQQMVGTPLYMSPEQAEMTGIDVDTRSDVYSLGVLLYELLTGTTPVDQDRLKKAAFDEVRRIIREEEPPRPSTRISTMGEQARGTISARRKSDPKRLGPLFRGELDWIVMKALEKDRNRRYETANGFAMDVQRYLADEPVSARPTSAAYRAEKFVRKHRVGVAAAAAVTAALVLGIVGTVAGLVRAQLARRGWEQEAKRARHQADRATALSDFMGRVLSSAKPGQDGRDVRVADLLDAAAADLDTRFRDQPDLEVAARLSLREGYDSLGLFEQSRDNLRRAHEASRLGNGEDSRETLRLAADLAGVMAYANEAAEAEPLARAAYDRAARVLGPSDPVTLFAGTSLADALDGLNRSAEAERLERNLIHHTPAPPDAFAHHRLWCLAQILARRGENAEAIRLMYQALETARATGRGDAAFRLIVTSQLGTLLAAEGRHDEAEAAYAAVVSDPAMLANQFTVGAAPLVGDSVEKGFSCAVRSYAELLDSRAKAGEAARVRSDHLAHLRAALPPPGVDSASALTRRANLLARLGRFKEAAADYARAIELNPGDHWRWYLLGCLLAYDDQPDAYRTHCALMLRHFGATRDRFVADRTAKTCLMMPAPTPDLAQQLRLLNVVLAPGGEPGLQPWFRMLEGMARYRQGSFGPAIESLEASRNGFNFEGCDAVKATGILFRAMAHHRLGHADQARALLAEARGLMEQKVAKAGVEDLEYNGVENWLICHVARREAEALLAGG